jgi:hypothetical protein
LATRVPLERLAVVEGPGHPVAVVARAKLSPVARDHGIDTVRVVTGENESGLHDCLYRCLAGDPRQYAKE